MRLLASGLTDSVLPGLFEPLDQIGSTLASAQALAEQTAGVGAADCCDSFDASVCLGGERDVAAGRADAQGSDAIRIDGIEGC